MDKRLLTSKLLALFAILFFSLSSYAQLPNFTVTATPTPQTCLGNGALAFTVSGTDPAASIDYTVYQMPGNVFVTTVTTPSLGSLQAGTYLVVATQSLGGQSNTSSVTVTIANQVQNLAYALVPTKVRCGNDGVITVNVTSGTAVQYEIISGPVTRPLQASNVFNNLPIGLYQVRVHDNCGTALSVNMQLVAAVPSIVVQAGGAVGGELPSCTTTYISHSYVPSNPTVNEIFFPVTFEFTVFPPGGGTPIIVTQTVPAGAPTNVNSITAVIPFYYDQQYSYNIKVTDACGNVFTRNNNSVNKEFTATGTQDTDGCSDYSVGFTLDTYRAPLTFNFTSSPAGFNPADYSGLHPTFPTEGSAVYGGVGNSLPEGSYTVQITDACGRVATTTFEIIPPEIGPMTEVDAECNSPTGAITIEIPGRVITTITITSAPATYTGPTNVIAFVGADGILVMATLPLGQYTFAITDSCGDVHEEVVDVEPDGGPFTLTVLQRPGCAIGDGSIRLRKENGDLATVTITAAPATYTNPLPHNVSANVSANGMFYMNSLPEGTYTFNVIDECGGTAVQNVLVEGYHMQVNEYDLIEQCNSFNLGIQHASNGTYLQNFWLQKFDPVTGTWGHPQTGVAYADGTLPVGTNSKLLTNNMVNINNQFIGQFRVIKSFYVYANGSSTNFLCTQIVEEFTFDPNLEIINAYGFPCTTNGTSEVVIEAEGVAPLTYAIVDAAGNVLVNNGTSNVFSNLATGTYIFRVSDTCLNNVTIPVDVNELAEIEIEAENLCEGLEGQLSVTQFSFLEYEWWKEGDPGTILSTTGVLSLEPFDSAIHAGTYHVRITSTLSSTCMDEQVLTYTINANVLANAGEDNAISYCNAGELLNVASYLSEPHDAGGVWTDVDNSGAFNNEILTTEGLAAGTYHFTYKVTGMCDSEDEATITIEVKDIPAAPVADAVAAVCEGEDVQLSIEAVPGAANYEWIGPANFTSTDQNPMIAQAGLPANGTYYVTVTVNGCTSPPTAVNVTVKPVPVFNIEGNTSLCVGQTGGLNVVALNGSFDENAATYQWYHDNVLQQDVTDSDIVILQTGTYRVVVDNNGCTSEKAVTVVENTNAFEVELEAGCKDFDYVVSVINAADLADVSYSWSGPMGFNAVGPEIVITGAPAGDYVVTATNVDGCTVVETINVPNTHCSIPKGISPGDADFNNEFDLSNLDVQHLKIFNRYGLEVYEKANYVNEWHGQSKSGELPTGTYYYELTLSKGKRVTGWVYLQRAQN